MDQATILAFLSNLIDQPYMNYLNDPFANMGLQQMLQAREQQQMLSDDDVARLLSVARGIDTRPGIPSRSVGSIFQPDKLSPETSFPTGPKLEPAPYSQAIDRTGLGVPPPQGEIYQGPTYARSGRDRQQLSDVGGIFPATLKDYYTPIFQPRPSITRSPINLPSRGGNIYGR